VPLEIRQLIRDMSLANPLWGAPRIHGELLKLGINVARSTVSGTIYARLALLNPGQKTFEGRRPHDGKAL
jgi:hypothetical protein